MFRRLYNWIKNKLKWFFIGGTALASTTTPIIPADMQFVSAHQISYQSQFYEKTITSAIGTEIVKYNGKVFPDDDGNGLISVAIFRGKDGSEVEIQIPDEQYSDMGKTGGFSRNPKKEEYLTVFEAMAQPAEAAIALDTYTSSFQSDSTSSWTWAYTTSGSNRFLMIGCLGGTIGEGDNITGITYNAVSMTKRDSNRIPTGRMTYLFDLTNPASGSNNVVVTKSGATYSECYAASYTGVSQTGQPEAHNTGTATAASSISIAVTTLTPGAWIVGFSAADTTSTYGCNKTVRYTASNEFTCDSNGAVSVGSNTMTATPDVAANMAMEVISIAPPTDATFNYWQFSDF